MSFDSKKIEYAREHFNLIEIELDYCSNTFGVFPCVGGNRTITTTAVSVDDFSVGDEIEGATSGAIGEINEITGSAPTYTFSYQLTNGIDFQTAAETITNNTAAGVATKNSSAPILTTFGDGKCFNTFETSQDKVNYTVTGTTTGKLDLSVDLSQRYNRTSGSFIDDGFVVGHSITISGFPANVNNNGIKEILTLTALQITVTDTTFMSPEPSFNQEQEIIVTATKVYRFCDPRSPLPTGLPSNSIDPDVIPSLAGVDISAQQIDVSGGLGTRSRLSIRFNDHPHSDNGVDKYLPDRTWLASDRGTFWTKLRARNSNYQFRAIRHLSGYLNEDGSFDAANFQTRSYVIDSLSATSGKASVVAKDPLKLAMQKKAQVPKPSPGKLSANLAAGVLTATLIPAGIGDSDYDTSGELVIKDEVIPFTRVADVLTFASRGLRNTTDTSHEINDTVQQCYVKNAQVNIIVKDLLENFVNIDPAFIPADEWQAEVDTYIRGLLDGIITKPMDVFKVINKELPEASPHYLWWDDRTQLINLTALKAPPISADPIDMNSNIIEDSFTTRDMIDMRKSTIFVNFAQFDPTKNLDEPGNWQQTHTRIDVDSVAKYNSNKIMAINSRWINASNKAQALVLAALYGRRFSDIPREISFQLDAKDSDIWIGQSRDVNHRDILSPEGIPVDTTFQIISVKESGNYHYTALEFTYGKELPEDEGGGDPDVDLVILGSNQKNINLRTIYNSLFPAPDASTKAKFIIENGIVIGSTSIGTASIDTGIWPAGALVTLQTDSGAFSVGKGGDGEHESGTPEETDGGDAINMQHDLEIINNGVIGSGGGGAKHNVNGDGSVPGAGGAGEDVGIVVSGNIYIGPGNITQNTLAGHGTLQLGGDRAILKWFDTEPDFVNGFDGGDLGQDGGGGGGAAGVAIRKNGNVLTETVTGDIRGIIT